MLRARMSTRRAWLRGTAWRVGALVGASLGPVAWSLAAEALKVLRPPVKTLPPIALIGMNGQAGKLDTELASEVPLLLNFVFTTCSSSCSVQTALLAQVQRRQGAATATGQHHHRSRQRHPCPTAQVRGPLRHHAGLAVLHRPLR
jgi:hypothetical protein